MLEKLWKTCPQIKLKLVDSSKRINLNLQLDKNLTLVVRPTTDHSVFYHNYQKYLKKLSMASFMNIWDKQFKNWSRDIFHKFNTWILEYFVPYGMLPQWVIVWFLKGHFRLSSFQEWQAELLVRWYLGTTLMDLSKGNDCLSHDLLITKLKSKFVISLMTI